MENLTVSVGMATTTVNLDDTVKPVRFTIHHLSTQGGRRAEWAYELTPRGHLNRILWDIPEDHAVSSNMAMMTASLRAKAEASERWVEFKIRLERYEANQEDLRECDFQE